MADYIAKLKLAMEGAQKTLSELNKVDLGFKKIESTSKNTTDSMRRLSNVSGRTVVDSFKNISTSGKQATVDTNDFIKAMRRAAIVAPVWTGIRMAMQGLGAVIKDQISYLIESENAMARMAVVGNNTKKELNDLKSSILALSQVYGVLPKDAMKAAVLFVQQGKTTSETFQLLKTAMMGSKVLGDDITTTVDNMTAALNAFNIPVNESISIMDKWIDVEKQFAVTGKDLADAVKTAGATASQMGVTQSEFLGDVTAIIETTRKTGSQAANAIQFMYARLQTTARPTIESLTGINFYLDKQGKITNELTGTFRGVSSIMAELAVKWDALTNSEKLAIATQVASKRQMTSFFALMQSYNTSISARISALDSAGSAEKAFAIIQETTATKMDKAKTAWNSLTDSIANTTAFKTGLDWLTAWAQNLEAAYSNKQFLIKQGKQEILEQTKINDSYITQAQNIRELIKVNDDLSNSKNKALKLKASEALESNISALEFGIGVKIDRKHIDKIEDTIDALKKQNIELTIKGNYRGEINSLLKDIDFWQTRIDSGWDKSGKALNKINQSQDKVNQLYKEQNKEITEALRNYGTQKIAEEARLKNDKERLEVEKEFVRISKQEELRNTESMNKARASGLFSEIELLNIEKELVNNSKNLYDERERSVKLMEIESKIRTEMVSQSNMLIGHEMNIAKMRGLTGRNLLSAELAMKSMIYGEKAVMNSLETRLKIEEEITKEKMNQVSIGNETVALYNLAQKYGRQTAMDVGSFVSGKTDYSQLEKTPKSLKAFEEFFGSWAEQLKAARYFGIPFRGERTELSGRRDILAKGYDIPIKEYEALKDFQNRVVSMGATSAQISNLVVNVNTAIGEGTTAEQKSALIISSIVEAIKNNVEIKKEIAQQIEEY